MRDKRWKAGLLGLFIAAACVLSGCSSASAVKEAAVIKPVEAESGKMDQKTWDFKYTGKVQTFTAPQNGTYSLECWGAQGGSSIGTRTETGTKDPSNMSEGGKGGYSAGDVYLTKGQTIYISVGGEGLQNFQKRNTTAYSYMSGAWNGGGSAKGADSDGDTISGAGGGATSIQKTLQGDGQLSNYDSVKNTDVYLVAGGGGGSAYYYCSYGGYSYGFGGYGGGETAGVNSHAVQNGSALTIVPAAGQGVTSKADFTAGTFGKGADGIVYGAGGGGGWYGGAIASGNSVGGAGGGSGHVGAMLFNGKDLDGSRKFRSPSGSDEIGHSGPGYARISFTSPEEIFVGWSTKADGSGTWYQPGDTVQEGTLTKDMDLYAQWMQTDFDYTGSVQTFTAPLTGLYQLECWGASGGSSVGVRTEDSYFDGPAMAAGGKGGYSSGQIKLNKGDKLYISVGGAGQQLFQKRKTNSYSVISGGWNGGGSAKGADSDGDTISGAGGGATSIQKSLKGDGQLSNYESVKDTDVYLVAGGGGGSSYYWCSYGGYHHGFGGCGGGETAGTNNNAKTGNNSEQDDGYIGPAAGQNAYSGNASAVAGTFGKGASHDYCGAGGGGGWYGGATEGITGAGGGSGYVSSVMSSAETLAGNKEFDAPLDGKETGHSGNGYARITLVSAN